LIEKIRIAKSNAMPRIRVIRVVDEEVHVADHVLPAG